MGEINCGIKNIIKKYMFNYFSRFFELHKYRFDIRQNLGP